MARFLLIHGSAHGAWCWRDLLPALRALGHEAMAIDLPSHGADMTPLDDVTLDAYADAVREVAAKMGGQVTLVGHSAGGYAITAAAQGQPKDIAGLVYLCAYLPLRDLGLIEMRKLAKRQPLLPALERAPDGLSFRIRADKAEGVFYHDCPPGVLDFALANLCPQAIAPQDTGMPDLSRAEALPRDYIVCEDDRAIPSEFQHEMASRLPAAQRHSLPTGHSPFFAAPAALAALLNQISQRQTV